MTKEKQQQQLLKVLSESLLAWCIQCSDAGLG
jgi:hypothetical protein